MAQLLPCPNCARHVRTHESRCPFCSVPIEAPGVSRLGAAFAVGVTMALAGCSSEPTKQDTQVKPITPESAPASSQGAVVVPATQIVTPTERMDAPAYGLAPQPERPATKYGAPPPRRPPPKKP